MKSGVLNLNFGGYARREYLLDSEWCCNIWRLRI